MRSVTFKYFLYGTDEDMGFLEIQFYSSSWKPLWSITGNQGMLWHTSTIFLPPAARQLRMVYRIKNPGLADVAVDSFAFDCMLDPATIASWTVGAELSRGATDCPSTPLSQGVWRHTLALPTAHTFLWLHLTLLATGDWGPASAPSPLSLAVDGQVLWSQALSGGGSAPVCAASRRAHVITADVMMAHTGASAELRLTAPAGSYSSPRMIAPLSVHALLSTDGGSEVDATYCSTTVHSVWRGDGDVTTCGGRRVKGAPGQLGGSDVIHGLVLLGTGAAAAAAPHVALQLSLHVYAYGTWDEPHPITLWLDGVAVHTLQITDATATATTTCGGLSTRSLHLQLFLPHRGATAILALSCPGLPALSSSQSFGAANLVLTTMASPPAVTVAPFFGLLAPPFSPPTMECLDRYGRDGLGTVFGGPYVWGRSHSVEGAYVLPLPHSAARVELRLAFFGLWEGENRRDAVEVFVDGQLRLRTHVESDNWKERECGNLVSSSQPFLLLLAHSSPLLRLRIGSKKMYDWGYMAVQSVTVTATTLPPLSAALGTATASAALPALPGWTSSALPYIPCGTAFGGVGTRYADRDPAFLTTVVAQLPPHDKLKVEFHMATIDSASGDCYMDLRIASSLSSNVRLQLSNGQNRDDFCYDANDEEQSVLSREIAHTADSARITLTNGRYSRDSCSWVVKQARVSTSVSPVAAAAGPVTHSWSVGSTTTCGAASGSILGPHASDVPLRRLYSLGSAPRVATAISFTFWRIDEWSGSAAASLTVDGALVWSLANYGFPRASLCHRGVDSHRESYKCNCFLSICRTCTRTVVDRYNYDGSVSVPLLRIPSTLPTLSLQFKGSGLGSYGRWGVAAVSVAAIACDVDEDCRGNGDTGAVCTDPTTTASACVCSPLYLPSTNCGPSLTAPATSLRLYLPLPSPLPPETLAVSLHPSVAALSPTVAWNVTRRPAGAQAWRMSVTTAPSSLFQPLVTRLEVTGNYTLLGHVSLPGGGAPPVILELNVAVLAPPTAAIHAPPAALCVSTGGSPRYLPVTVAATFSPPATRLTHFSWSQVSGPTSPPPSFQFRETDRSAFATLPVAADTALFTGVDRAVGNGGGTVQYAGARRLPLMPRSCTSVSRYNAGSCHTTFSQPSPDTTSLLLLRFDLAALRSAGVRPEQLLTASLRLHAATADAPAVVGLNLQLVVGEWAEDATAAAGAAATAAGWGLRPAPPPPPPLGKELAESSDAWADGARTLSSAELAAAVAGWLADPERNYGVALTATLLGEWTEQAFLYSREAGPALAPSLHVTYRLVSSSSPPVTTLFSHMALGPRAPGSYVFRVEAVDDLGAVASDSVTVVAEAAPVITSFDAANVTGGMMSLHWTSADAGTPLLRGFVLQWRVAKLESSGLASSASPFVTLFDDAADASLRRWELYDLTRSTRYHFRLAGYNPTGCRGDWRELYVRTRPTTPPAQPAPVLPLRIAGDAITVGWTPPRDSGGELLVGYDVTVVALTGHFSTGGAGGVTEGLLHRVGANTLTVSGLQTFSPIDVYFTAKNRQFACVGASPPSHVVRVWTSRATPPSPPLHPTLTSRTGGCFQTSWSLPALTGGLPVTGYKLFIRPLQAAPADDWLSAPTHSEQYSAGLAADLRARYSWLADRRGDPRTTFRTCGLPFNTRQVFRVLALAQPDPDDLSLALPVPGAAALLPAVTWGWSDPAGCAVVLWMLVDAPDGTSSFAFFASSSNGQNGVSIRRDPGNFVTWNVAVGPAPTQTMRSAAPIPRRVWVHVAVTVSDTSADMYIDGALSSSSTDPAFRPPLVARSVVRLGLGPSHAPGWFVGEMDNLRLWPTAVSLELLRTRMSSLLPDPSATDAVLVCQFSERLSSPPAPSTTYTPGPALCYRAGVGAATAHLAWGAVTSDSTRSDGDLSAPLIVSTNPYPTGPSAPRNVTVAATSGGSVTLSLTPPEDDGGVALTGYRVEVAAPPALGGCAAAVDSDYRTVRVEPSPLLLVARDGQGLPFTADTQYCFRVSCVNVVDGSPSRRVAARTVNVTLPRAPPVPALNFSGQTEMAVQFQPPWDTGGAAITAFHYSFSRTSPPSPVVVENGTLSAAASSIFFSSLMGDTEYSLAIRASNSQGDGPWSPPLLVRTRALDTAWLAANPHVGCLSAYWATIWWSFPTTAVPGTALSYDLRSSSGGASPVPLFFGGRMQYRAESLAAASAYSLTLRFVHPQSGNSPFSSAQPLTTLLSPHDVACLSSHFSDASAPYNHTAPPSVRRWHISPPPPFAQLWIHFHTFELECDHDSLTLTLAHTGALLWAGGCPRAPGALLLLSAHPHAAVNLTLTTDALVGGRGLNFSYGTQPLTAAQASAAAYTVCPTGILGGHGFSEGSPLPATHDSGDSGSNSTDVAPPALQCSNRGTCDGSSGRCHCLPGFTGEDCSFPVYCPGNDALCAALPSLLTVSVHGIDAPGMGDPGSPRAPADGGTAGKPLRSVAAALAAAADGDTVLLLPGDHLCGATLSAPPRRVTVTSLAGGNATRMVCPPSQPAFTVQGGGTLVVVGIQIVAAATDTTADASGSGGGGGSSSGGGGGDGGALVVLSGHLNLLNVTVTGMSAARGGAAFVAASASLAASDCELQGNSAAREGGGLWCGGHCTLNRTTLRANFVTAGDGGGLHCSGHCALGSGTVVADNLALAGSGGGAFVAPAAHLSAHRAALSGCLAVDGAALACAGACAVTHSTFSRSHATNAGGALLCRGTCALAHSSVHRHAARAGGGMACTGHCTLTASFLSHNHASALGAVTAAAVGAHAAFPALPIGTGGDGGALWLHSAAPALLSHSRFLHNSASHRGGALFALPSGPSSSGGSSGGSSGSSGSSSSSSSSSGLGVVADAALLTVQSVNISHCSAAQGGAVFTSAPTSITAALLSHNQATEAGGAIACDAVATATTSPFLSLTSTSVLENRAVATAAAATAGRGGGLWLRQCSTATRSVAIVGNSADSGGGVALSSSTALSAPASSPLALRGNRAAVTPSLGGAGGGILVFPHPPLPSPITAAAASLLPTAVLTHIALANNTAAAANAAVGSPDSGAAPLSSPTASAADGGGVAVAAGASLSFSHFTAHRCTAAGSGGGVHAAAHSTLSLSNFSLTHCAAGRAGGGIALSASHATLQSATIQHCSSAGDGGGVSAVAASTLSLSAAHLRLNSAGGGGGGLHLAARSSAAALRDCSLSLNTAATGGGCYLHSSALSAPPHSPLPLVNNSLTHPRVNDGGGCVLAGPDSSLAHLHISGSAARLGGGLHVAPSATAFLTSLRIHTNVASERGGGLHLALAAAVTLNHTWVAFNEAGVEGGGLALATAARLTASAVGVNLNAAGSSGGGIAAIAASLLLSNASVSHNTAREGNGGGISAGQSGLWLDGVRVEGNSAVELGGGAVLTQDSSLVALRCTLSRNRVAFDGGALLLSKSTAQLNSSSLRGNGAYNGGALFVTSGAELRMHGGDCSGNGALGLGGCAYLARGTATQLRHTAVSNNSAMEGGGGVFVADSQHVLLVSVPLRRNVASGQGGALLVDRTSLVLLRSCSFLHNAASGQQGGGAVAVRSYARLHATACTFAFNCGDRGGALSLSVFARATVTGGAAHGNRASTGGAFAVGGEAELHLLSTSLTANAAARDGGAVHAQRTPQAMAAASAASAAAFARPPGFLTVSSCTFTRNAAGGQFRGGAIFLGSVQAVSVSDSAFTQNTAGVGGGIHWLPSPDTAVGSGSHLTCVRCTAVNNSVLFLSSEPLAISVGWFPTHAVQSGVVMEAPPQLAAANGYPGVFFTVVDYYSQVAPLAFGQTCSIYRSAQEKRLVLVQRAVATAAAGVMQMPRMTAKAAPDDTPYALTRECTLNGEVSFHPTPLRVRACDPGFWMDEKGLCTRCLEGTYSHQGVECTPCPEGGWCTAVERNPLGDLYWGSDWPVATRGYWRWDVNSSEEFLPCRGPGCSGRVVDPVTQRLLQALPEGCVHGYVGNLCNKCANGFGTSVGGECRVCRSKASNRALMLLAAALMFLSVAGLIRSSLRVVGADCQSDGMLRIYMTYLQTVSLAANFDLKWPPAVLSMFRVQSSVTTMSEQLLSVDCEVTEKPGATPKFWKMQMVYMSLPPIMLACCVLFWGAKYQLDKAFSKEFRDRFTRRQRMLKLNREETARKLKEGPPKPPSHAPTQADIASLCGLLTQHALEVLPASSAHVFAVREVEGVVEKQARHRKRTIIHGMAHGQGAVTTARRLTAVAPAPRAHGRLLIHMSGEREAQGRGLHMPVSELSVAGRAVLFRHMVHEKAAEDMVHCNWGGLARRDHAPNMHVRTVPVRSQSVLALPICDDSGEVMAVLEARHHSLKDAFTAEGARDLADYAREMRLVVQHAVSAPLHMLKTAPVTAESAAAAAAAARKAGDEAQSHAGGRSSAASRRQQQLVSRMWSVARSVRASNTMFHHSRTHRHNTVASFVVLMYMLYPRIVRKVFTMVTCDNLGARPGHTQPSLFLREDFDQECYSPQHVRWLLMLGLPALLLYVIAVPLVAFAVLHKNRLHLRSSAATFQYSFLYSGFKPRYYYWELTVMARKACFVLISLFLAQYGTDIQTYTALAFLAVSFAAHVTAEPYADQQLHDLEKHALATALLTMWLGMLLFSGVLGAGVRIFITVLLFACNLTYSAYFLWQFVGHSLQSVRLKYHSARVHHRRRTTAVAPAAAAAAAAAASSTAAAAGTHGGSRAPAPAAAVTSTETAAPPAAAPAGVSGSAASDDWGWEDATASPAAAATATAVPIAAAAAVTTAATTTPLAPPLGGAGRVAAAAAASQESLIDAPLALVPAVRPSSKKSKKQQASSGRGAGHSESSGRGAGGGGSGSGRSSSKKATTRRKKRKTVSAAGGKKARKSKASKAVSPSLS